MRDEELNYIMESMLNGQKKQAVALMLRGCKTNPAKLLRKFVTLNKTTDNVAESINILFLLEAVTQELENE